MKGGFEKLCGEVSRRRGLGEGELMSGGRRATVMQAREDVAQVAVKSLGMSGAEVALRMGVTARSTAAPVGSCINRIVATREPSPEAKKIADELAK